MSCPKLWGNGRCDATRTLVSMCIIKSNLSISAVQFWIPSIERIRSRNRLGQLGFRGELLRSCGERPGGFSAGAKTIVLRCMFHKSRGTIGC
jgi:hypothetical protein